MNEYTLNIERGGHNYSLNAKIEFEQARDRYYVSLSHSVDGGQVKISDKLLTKEKAWKFSWPEKICGLKDSVAGIRLNEFFDETETALAALEEEANRLNEEYIESIKNGSTAITVHYHDGEYLSGYCLFGKAANLLEEIGAARYINGWGYIINTGMVETLGETFTFPQALEYTRPAQEAKAAEHAKREAAIKAKFDEAAATGKPVALRTWMSDCHEPDEDCDFDSNTEYAMPDGSTKIVWDHCY